MSRMGVVVLTADGNALWYARIFEFARVLHEACGAEVAHGMPETLSRRLGPRVRRHSARAFSVRLPHPIPVESLFEDEVDTIIVLASGVGDLLLLPEIELPKTKKTVLVLFELWLPEIAAQLPLLKVSLKRFTHVAISWRGALDQCRAVLRHDVIYIAEATDVVTQLAIGKRVRKADELQVVSYGRTDPAQYAALTQAWREGQIRYRFDSIAGWRCSVPLADHRRKLMEELAASQFVVANLAKFNEPDLMLKHGASLGPRFLEIAAAGAIPVGHFPDDLLQAEMGLRGLAVPIAQSSEMVNRIRAIPDAEFREMTRQNILTVLQRHDWAYRVDDLLRLIGETPTQGLVSRHETLNQLRQQHAPDELARLLLAACSVTGQEPRSVHLSQ